ncbi:hypothetical protein L9F63_016479 [Diploptera punctata]|uniref:Uncharacterized protein n=1 Tax=Diploptera punctata TaxID=6984 RepID=A0AAD8A177_DIPPU|nr:hypothetical protein L9F63_016479 [Diploptera punctata]
MVNCECGIGDKADYQPEQVNGKWYVDYSSPDIFGQMSDVTIEFHLENKTYQSVLTFTYTNESSPKVYDSTWSINKDGDLEVEVPQLSNFNSVYRIVAAEENEYIIFRGCPEISDGKPLLFIETEKRCPNVQKLKEAVQKLGMDLSTNFYKDPAVNC